MTVPTNKKTLGWSSPRRRVTVGYQYIVVLFLFLSCGRRDILTDPTTTTTTQQTPTDPGQDIDTPLHEAILGQADLVSLYPFLQATSIDQPDNEGNTPLHWAVIQDNLPLRTVTIRQGKYRRPECSRPNAFTFGS